MRKVQRTLHVATQGTHLRLEGGAVVAKLKDEPLKRLPLNGIDAIHLYGSVGTTTALVHRAAAEGPHLVWFSRSGRFIGRLQSAVSGNILLRQAQHKGEHDANTKLSIAQRIVAAKIVNSRGVLDDAAKDRPAVASELRETAKQLTVYSKSTRAAADADTLRGIEGQAAKLYFQALNKLISNHSFRFETRTRRPPLDPTNSLLSFLYGMVRIRCSAACEAVGLDPQLGFLHEPRPGRESLALDLLEEFRAPFADRLGLSLLNRRQLKSSHFESRPGGAVNLTDTGRKIVFAALDTFMSAEVACPTLEEKVPRAYVPQVQANILARHLRGDLQHYLPFRASGR